MTSVEAYEFVRKLANHPVTGNVTPEKFESFFNFHSAGLFKELVGNYDKYGNARPAAPIGDEISSVVIDALSPFRTSAPVSIVNGTGLYNPNGDYERVIDVWATGYDKSCGDAPDTVKRRISVKSVPLSSWATRTMAGINRPTNRKPICTFLDASRMEVSPVTVTHVELWYYRRPPKIAVGRTYINSRPVLDPNAANNVDPVWRDSEMQNLLMKVASSFGVSLQDAGLWQAATNREGQGS